MAELVLKVGTVGADPAYQDGDIVDVFNRRRIRCCHAEVICDHRKLKLNQWGLRPRGTFHEDLLLRTFQYRLERVSRTEARRVNQFTLAEDVLGARPNGNGEYINVERFLDRRLRSSTHRIFGTAGNEVWYCGTKDVSHSRLDLLWSDIEAKTDFLESNFTQWPLSSKEKRFYLAVSVEDFDDATVALLKSSVFGPGPIVDGGPTVVVVQKRQRFVNWRDQVAVLGTSEGDVDDRDTEIDVRGVQLVRDSIVQVKP